MIKDAISIADATVNNIFVFSGDVSFDFFSFLVDGEQRGGLYIVQLTLISLHGKAYVCLF